MIKPVLRGYKLLNQVTVTKTIDTIRQKFRGYEMRDQMAKALKQQYDTEEYIKQDKSSRVEKAEAWRIAIGLQAVDGLRVSEYLLYTAREHVAGNITIDEVLKRVQSYYEQYTERPFFRKAVLL